MELMQNLKNLFPYTFFVLSNFSAIRVCCFYYLKSKYSSKIPCRPLPRKIKVTFYLISCSSGT